MVTAPEPKVPHRKAYPEAVPDHAPAPNSDGDWNVF
jgi:hypothetical protein